MGARSWTEGRTARQHHPPPHHNPAAAVTTGQTQRLQPDSHRPNQLHPASSVLYVPVSNQERLLREKVSLQDRQIRNKSVRLDLELGLPPSLPLPDGEEPYGSLQNFHMRDPEQEREIYSKCIRPPPNRTVFESGSPPLYRSNSHGSESGSLTPPRDCNSTQLVMRCHSANNNAAATRNGNMGAAGAARNSTSASSVLRCSSHSHHHLHPHPHPHQQQHLALPATTNLVLAPMARHSASCAPDGEPPPGYSEAIATSGGQQPNNGV
uniref:Uncharacterized protein n=1 Tax=Strigamia maritima TaxID=126957 RepID=T1J504_STRMM